MLTKLLALLIGFAHAQGAPTYLVQPTIAAAQARSAAQCTTNGCDGTHTKYWWPVQPLTDNTAAIVIVPGSSQDVTWDRKVGACAVGCGLTAPEIAALQTATAMGTKLPWIVSEAAFMARFTPIQISKANASSDPAVSVPWAAIKAASTVDLTSGSVNSMVNAMVADSIVTQANAQTILAPVAVAAVPQ